MSPEKLNKTPESVIINSILILRKAIQRHRLKEIDITQFSEMLTEIQQALGMNPQLEPKQLNMTHGVLSAAHKELLDPEHPLFNKEPQVQTIFGVVDAAVNSGISIEDAYKKIKEGSPDFEEPRAVIANIFGEKH